MFVRMRWFTFGVLASLGVMAYVVNQLRRMRERLTPQHVAREMGRAASMVLDGAAERVSPSGR